LDEVKQESGRITLKEYKKMSFPAVFSAIVGIIIGIIPGTGASMASFVSYDRVKSMSKHKQEFGNGSIEGIAAAETANNAVTGATLIPLLTMGIPGDGVAAIMLGALMINGLTPGPNLFVKHGVTMYAIMIGLIFVNIFMYVQGKTLTKYFARVVSIPVSILTPIIVIFCFAGAFSVNNSLFDVRVTLAFAVIAYVFSKLGFSTIPILLGLVLGDITEENFRRSLILSDGSWSIFVQSPISIAFLVVIALTLVLIVRGKINESKQ
jgi:putative tricarboxylic transport membrane protein